MPRSELTKSGKYYEAKGFGLGASILTVTQLKQVYSLLAKVVGDLNDPTQDVLKRELKERLKKANIDVDQDVPIRGFANRSILDEKHADTGTLAHKNHLDKVAQAISECKAIRLKVRHQGGQGVDQVVWPLQILFHNVAWYLAYQQTHTIRGVIAITRLDRLRLSQVPILPQRRSIKDMLAAQERLRLLCKRCGGILLSKDGILQEDVLGLSTQEGGSLHEPSETLSQKQLKALIKKGSMTEVRFRCTPKVFRFMREGLNRYPKEQMRLSGPLEHDDWEAVEDVTQLQPLSGDVSHPYPVEFILPCWTAAEDRDFRRWLFGFGGGIVIEKPVDLRDEHQNYGAKIAALYANPPTPAAEPATKAGASAASAEEIAG